MALSDKSSRQALIPSFLYSSSSATTLEKMMLAAKPSSSGAGLSSNLLDGSSPTRRSNVFVAAPSEPGKRIEMYSSSFYAACTAGGILSCGLTHTGVTPLDLVKCNMQVRFL
jgi:solute carrier family 25 phosphate transporter 3